MKSHLYKRACAIGLLMLLTGCGTATMSGRMEGKKYVSRSGDLACSFPLVTRDTVVTDYIGDDGEWISTNFAGVDIERIERFVLGKGTVERVTDANALADALLPLYMVKSERIKSTEVIARKPVALGARGGLFTLLAFDTFTPENQPQRRRDIRGILWLVGEKYGTAIHVYNWQYKDTDAVEIERRALGVNQRCSFRG
jgi:hypothetical protein